MINFFISISIMFCDLKGAVLNPGVYEVKNHNIYEIINIAGGLKKDAYLKHINLSKKITDEMVIYIPSINDKPKVCPKCNCPEIKICSKEISKTTVAAPKTTTIPSTITTTIPTTSQIITTTVPTTAIIKIVNINIANKEELMTLNGVGEKIAENIIEYRINNSFLNIEDLMNVKGIGEAIFAKIKTFITV